MGFADVILACGAHSFCLAVLLPQAEMAPFFFFFFDWPSCSLWCARTRFSFHNGHRGFCAGQALPSLNVWGDKSLSQQLKEHSVLVFLPWPPGRVDLLPYHKGIVCGHVNDVVEEDQGPACSHSFAAVRPNIFVKAVHAPFISVVVQDYGWWTSGRSSVLCKMLISTTFLFFFGIQTTAHLLWLQAQSCRGMEDNSTHLSKSSLMAASLSIKRLAGLDSRLSKCSILEKIWKFFSGIVAQKLALPLIKRPSRHTDQSHPDSSNCLYIFENPRNLYPPGWFFQWLV